jgi:hypothetical protein
VHEGEDLCPVLAIAARPPSLDFEVEAMGLTWENFGSGYLRTPDGLFTLFVVELDVVRSRDAPFDRSGARVCH